MHRPKTERQALAHRLLGTATEPGPIDVGWLKARYGIEGSHIKRWREQGIPAARIDELEAAVRELAGTTKEPPPEWAGAMEERLTEALLTNRKVFVDTMATHFAQLGVERALDDPPPIEPDPETPAALPGPAERT